MLLPAFIQCSLSCRAMGLTIDCSPVNALMLLLRNPLPLNCQGGLSLPSSFYSFFGSAGGIDEAMAVCLMTDGGMAVAGYASANIVSLQGKTPINAYTGLNDFLVIKLNSSGSVEWYTFLGSNAGNDSAAALSQTADGGLVVLGKANADAPALQGKTPINAYTGQNDFLAIKLNSSGSVEWYTFLGDAGSDDFASSMTQSYDGGFYLAGQSNANIPSLQGKTPVNAFSSLIDMMVIKINSSGSVEWYTFLGGTGVETASAITLTADGGLAVTGQGGANIPLLQGKAPLNVFAGSSDFYTVKLNAAGSVEWHTFMGSAVLDTGWGIVQTSDGGLAVVGTASANIASVQGKTPLIAYAGSNDCLTLKLNSAGALEWYSFIGGAGLDQPNAVTLAADGGIVVAGQSNANIASLQGNTPRNAYTALNDFLVVKITLIGAVEWYTFLGSAAGGDMAFAVSLSSDGGLVLAGSASANIAALQGKTPINAFTGIMDLFIVKLKADGNL